MSDQTPEVEAAPAVEAQTQPLQFSAPATLPSAGEYVADGYWEVQEEYLYVEESENDLLDQVEDVYEEGLPNLDAFLRDLLVSLGDTDAVNYDFAEAEPICLSGYVFHDRDNDGIRDPEEIGLAYITVELYTNGTLVATNETDADGFPVEQLRHPGQIMTF